MKKGFTLLEVLITISILAVISILAAQTIQQAIKSKVKIQDQVDDLSRVRDALRLMEKDLALAYHHRDFEKEVYDQLKKQQQPASPTPQPGGAFPPPQQPAEEREAPRQDPTTQFMGDAEVMNFVTLNNSRIQTDQRQADFVEVGYFVKDCKSTAKGGGRCLWRRSSPIVDSDVSKGGDELVLLDHVAELSFKFIGKGKDEWVQQWHTDQSGDAMTKDLFPAAVEISLTFKKGEGDKIKKYSMQTVAPIHFPNNKEETAKNAATP